VVREFQYEQFIYGMVDSISRFRLTGSRWEMINREEMLMRGNGA
jgi:hypothetical protein